MKRCCCTFLILLCWQISSATTVKLVTIGPGDAFWSAFGHSAIAINDDVYGFGYFSFDDELLKSFVANKMDYDLDVSDFYQELRWAQLQKRDFSTIELNLSTAETKQLKDYLQWHMLPENQSYRYDYFLNNCSTKVRDILDVAWNGKLKQSSQEITASSYFQQTFPAKHQGWMNFGLALGYGWPAYTYRNAWELMAFPVYLEQNVIENFSHKFQPKQMIYQAEASNQWISFFKTHWLLIVYVGLWSLFLVIKRTQQFVAKTWFIWHGFIGLILLALWLLTPHAVADWNFNVLLMMPIGLLLHSYHRLIPLVAVSWLMWLILAIYLNAWYLMPLLLPAMLALKTFQKPIQGLIKRT